MSFSTSQLDYNHQGGDFCLEGKIKRHKMVAPKGSISNDMLKRISRSIDNIEEICNTTNKCLNINEDDVYKETDLYDEIVSWRAALHCSGMLGDYNKTGSVRSIYNEVLSSELDCITDVALSKKDIFWSNIRDGKEIKNNMYEYMHVIDDNNSNSDEDDEHYLCFSNLHSMKPS